MRQVFYSQEVSNNKLGVAALQKKKGPNYQAFFIN